MAKIGEVAKFKFASSHLCRYNEQRDIMVHPWYGESSKGQRPMTRSFKVYHWIILKSTGKNRGILAACRVY